MVFERGLQGKEGEFAQSRALPKILEVFESLASPLRHESSFAPSPEFVLGGSPRYRPGQSGLLSFEWRTSRGHRRDWRDR